MADKFTTREPQNAASLELKSFTGNVLLLRGTQSSSVRVGEKLESGDVLQVASASSVTLVLGDGRLWFSADEQTLVLSDENIALIEQQAGQENNPLAGVDALAETGNIIFTAEGKNPIDVKPEIGDVSNSIARATRLERDAVDDATLDGDRLLTLDAETSGLVELPSNVAGESRVHDDALTGLAGAVQNDSALTARGNYTLSQQGDRDLFVWGEAVSADSETPAVDILSGFTLGPAGDVLDLSDLLVGEDAASVSNYLAFSVVTGDSIIAVDAQGKGDFERSYKVVLEGIDVSLLGDSNATIASKLISDGNLQIDL